MSVTAAGDHDGCTWGRSSVATSACVKSAVVSSIETISAASVCIPQCNAGRRRGGAGQASSSIDLASADLRDGRYGLGMIRLAIAGVAVLGVLAEAGSARAEPSPFSSSRQRKCGRRQTAVPSGLFVPGAGRA